MVKEYMNLCLGAIVKAEGKGSCFLDPSNEDHRALGVEGPVSEDSCFGSCPLHVIIS